MSYAKLFSSITESSLWSEPKEARLLFVSMLARADATGFVEAALPGLARLANLSISEVESAIDILEKPDPYSKNPDNEGRRVMRVPGGWMILNYEVYRNRRGDEERREYMRQYMANYRRRKQNVNSPVNNPVYGVSEKANCKPEVSRGKPQLAQAEAEAEAYKDNNMSGKPDVYCQARIALMYLNEKAGKHFREIDTNLKPIHQRLKEVGGDLDGVKQMIDRMCSEWKGDVKMDRYLRPETLFNKTKFHGYYDLRDIPVRKSKQNSPEPTNSFWDQL